MAASVDGAQRCRRNERRHERRRRVRRRLTIASSANSRRAGADRQALAEQQSRAPATSATAGREPAAERLRQRQPQRHRHDQAGDGDARQPRPAAPRRARRSRGAAAPSQAGGVEPDGDARWPARCRHGREPEQREREGDVGDDRERPANCTACWVSSRAKKPGCEDLDQHEGRQARPRRRPAPAPWRRCRRRSKAPRSNSTAMIGAGHDDQRHGGRQGQRTARIRAPGSGCCIAAVVVAGAQLARQVGQQHDADGRCRSRPSGSW